MQALLSCCSMTSDAGLGAAPAVGPLQQAASGAGTGCIRLTGLKHTVMRCCRHQKSTQQWRATTTSFELTLTCISE